MSSSTWRRTVIELTARDVALHLFACHAVLSRRSFYEDGSFQRRRVPLIVLPTVHPRGKLSPLFKRELLNCSLDLAQAHFTIIMLEIRRRNTREASIISSDPLLLFCSSSCCWYFLNPNSSFSLKMTACPSSEISRQQSAAQAKRCPSS